MRARRPAPPARERHHVGVSTVPLPQLAALRPRVAVCGGEVPRLLEEVVAELLAKGERVVVSLVGPSGSGKTTALRHLAARFADDARLRLFDDAPPAVAMAGPLVTILALRVGPTAGTELVLKLAPWSDDDCLEYLMHRHPRDVAA